MISRVKRWFEIKKLEKEYERLLQENSELREELAIAEARKVEAMRSVKDLELQDVEDRTKVSEFI